MTTARPQQRYDHRLRELVHRTDMETGSPLGQIRVPEGVRSVVASPSENYLGNHRFSSLAQLRNSRNGMLAAVLPVLGQTGSMAFSEDGTLVAADDWDNRVFIFRADSHPGYHGVTMEAVAGRRLGRNVRQLQFVGKDRVLATTRFGVFECTVGAPMPRSIYPSATDRRPYRISADERHVLTIGFARKNFRFGVIQLSRFCQSSKFMSVPISSA